MSFGFGIGDFLAVIELENKVRDDFRDAPDQFSSITHEIQSLAVLLAQIKEDVGSQRLEQRDQKGLETVPRGPTAILEKLKGFLDKHSALAADPQADTQRSLTRVWRGLTTDSREFDSLRIRLTSNTTMLGHFMQDLDARGWRRTLASLENRNEKEDQQEILDWISKDCDAHWLQFSSLLQRRENGTRKWLFESSEWQEWMSPDHQGFTLYCPGIPGAGKTFTTAMAIERLYEEGRARAGDWSLAYAFCNFKRSEKRKEEEHVQIARSLLRMILEQHGGQPLED